MFTDSLMDRYPAVQYHQQPICQADFTGHLTKIFYAGDSKKVAEAVPRRLATAPPRDGDSDDEDNDDGFLTCSSRGSRGSRGSKDSLGEADRAAPAAPAAPTAPADKERDREQRKRERQEKREKLRADVGAVRGKSPVAAGADEDDNRLAVVKDSEIVHGKRPVESAHQWIKSNPTSPLIDSVEWMSRAVRTQAGRDAFIGELNQFRSKKVRPFATAALTNSNASHTTLHLNAFAVSAG